MRMLLRRSPDKPIVPGPEDVHYDGMKEVEAMRELVEIIVKFNLLALDNFRTSVGHPLHSMDISKIIRREIQYVADTILQEDYMEIIEERTKSLFANS